MNIDSIPELQNTGFAAFVVLSHFTFRAPIRTAIASTCVVSTPARYLAKSFRSTGAIGNGTQTNSASCRVEILTPISAESLRKTRKEFSVGPGNLRICDRFGRRDLDEKLAQSHAPTARTTTDRVTENDGPRTGRARIESLPTRLSVGIGWPRCRDLRPVVSLKSGTAVRENTFTSVFLKRDGAGIRS